MNQLILAMQNGIFDSFQINQDPLTKDVIIHVTKIIANEGYCNTGTYNARLALAYSDIILIKDEQYIISFIDAAVRKFIEQFDECFKRK